MTLPELRQHFYNELFQVFLPFWDKHGIDRDDGGFFCALDYDGTRVGADKFSWFQGRGLWVYSFLYDHFGRDPRHLEVARKTKEYLLKHTSDDLYSMYFAAEGLQEYAHAAGDDQARQTAFDLVKKLFGRIGQPGPPPQAVWMVNLRIATQMLRRWHDPEIAASADSSVDAIIHKHYNPDTGLNSENLEEPAKCLIGHSIESLWMAMDEADRRNDSSLWNTCAERIRRHLEAGWDPVFGGIVQAVNVDQGGYQWPPERPVGTDLEFRGAGEYFYLKPLWALNEALIATLNVLELRHEEWAAQFFERALRLIEEKYSQKKHGLPGYMLFADRRFTRQPHVQRQDNYHLPRQLMLNILTLERIMSR